MRVLVVGMPGAGNLGDDLISVMLAHHVLARWPGAELGVLCADHPIPLSYSHPEQIRFFPMPRRRSWADYIGRMRAINRFARTANLILIGGGGLFQDSHYRFTPHKWLRVALRVSRRKIPAAAVGVGFGPFDHSFSQWYLQKGLSRLAVIQVRDQGSFKVVTSLGYEASVAPDVVSGTSLTNTPFDIDVQTEPALGCSIRPWPGLDFDALTNLIETVAEKNNYSVSLFVFEHAEPHNKSEYEHATRIAEALKQKGIIANVYCYGRESIEEFARAFNSVTKAVAFRLHANILWQKVGVPVLPISYAPKVTRLYEERGGQVIPVDLIRDADVFALFQNIEFSNSYVLPADDELLGGRNYNPYYLYLLGLLVGMAETGYGLTRSLSWRLQRLMNAN